MTPFTLVRLFPTVYTLVTLQVVLLDEAHITYVTLKWLLTWPRWRERSEHQEVYMAGTSFQVFSQKSLTFSNMQTPNGEGSPKLLVSVTLDTYNVSASFTYFLSLLVFLILTP